MKNKELNILEKQYVDWLNYVMNTDDDITIIVEKFPLEELRESMLESKDFRNKINFIRRGKKLRQIRKKLIK